MADNIIELRDLEFSYPTGLRVLDGVELAIRRGTSFGIVGPSGCGKSTLLRLIGGLAEPSGGHVLARPATDRHATTMLFQQDTLLPWRTVEQNVRLHFDLHRKKENEAAQRKRTDLIAMVGLTDFAGAYPHQLSGGMRRRAALLVAVAPDPAVLLLDEPFSSVDEPTRIAIHQELLGILAESGVTMILVTHDLNEAISLCDQVAILSARPTSVVSVFDTADVGDKSDLLSLRKRPEYLSFYARLWDELMPQIRAS